MKEKLKKHKKLLIILGVLLIVILGVSILSSQMKKKQQQMLETMNRQETALLEKRSLVSSVSATGVITSVDSNDLSVSLTGVEVEDVLVEVGDTVSVGDILCTFNAEDIEDSLNDAKVSLHASTSKSQIDVASSERGLAEAVESRDIDLARYSDDVADALSDYQEALDDAEDAKEAYEDAEDEADNYEDQLNALNSQKSRLESEKNKYITAFNTAKEAIENHVNGNQATLTEEFAGLTIDDATEIPSDANAVYTSNVTSSGNSEEGSSISELTLSEEDNNVDELNLSEEDDDESVISNEISVTNNGSSTGSVDEALINDYLNEMRTAKEAYAAKDWNTELSNIASQITTVQKKYETAKQTESSLESAYDNAVTAADNKYDAYEQKVRNQEDAARSNESTIANKTDSVKTSKLNASTTGMSDKNQIEQYEEQLENCTVTAPIAGVITAVNIEAGDIYNGTALLTIEDNSSYKVSAEIDEYDIGKIAVGQKVVIKTNGTGDEELEGTVQKIAPRATSGSSEVTYNVRISVDTPNDMLRMDMTAKLSIILESKENVLTVPYEAVIEDEDGAYYVEVVKQNQNSETKPEEKKQDKPGDMPASLQTEKVFVEKGIESDYYIEVISDSLQEGMEIVVPKSENDGMDIQMMMQRGPMGGF